MLASGAIERSGRMLTRLPRSSRVADELSAWPTSSRLHQLVAERLRLAISELSPTIAGLLAAALSKPSGVLSARPHSGTVALVAGCAVSAGAAVEWAAWPAASMEVLLVAADVLDDLADEEIAAYAPRGPGELVTLGGGLVAIAAGLLGRAAEDGLPAARVAPLVTSFGVRFGEAVAGQIAALGGRRVETADEAYELAVGKSGPLGELAAELGAALAGRRATTWLPAYRALGRHFAVWSQLLNDVRDAAPEAPAAKNDVLRAMPTVPLVFAGSYGPPPGLAAADQAGWEAVERQRVADAGGLLAGRALAELHRLKALEELDRLARRGRPVAGLRALLA
jgi:geranylgeranyl pyrophosphate synthase